MEGGKKVIVIIALIIGVVAFVWWRVSSSDIGRGVEPPKHVKNRSRTMIDEKTLELIEMTVPEWEELGRDAIGRWKHPVTGEYTLVPPIRCHSCGEWTTTYLPTAEEVEGLDQEAFDAVLERGTTRHKCPKCGGKVYPF